MGLGVRRGRRRADRDAGRTGRTGRVRPVRRHNADIIPPTGPDPAPGPASNFTPRPRRADTLPGCPPVDLATGAAGPLPSARPRDRVPRLAGKKRPTVTVTVRQ